MADLQTRTSSALRALADRETAERAAAERTGASTVNVPRSLESATAVSEELAVIAANISTAFGTSHPNPSTDNVIARYDGTTGDLQDSGVTIDDSGNMALPAATKLDVDKIEVSGDFALDCRRAATTNTFLINNGLNPNGCNLTVEGGITAELGFFATAGDVTVSSGNITVSGTVDGRDVAADGTKLDGAVLEADYNANSILAATSDDTPVVLTVAEDTIIGRVTGGNIDDIKGPQVSEVLFGDTFNTWKSNKWYTQSPGSDGMANSTGYVLVTNTVHYFPLSISHRVTFDVFGFQVVVTEGGKNARVAIFNASAGAPTSVVVESGNITLAGAGNVSVAVTATTIEAGEYFWAVNADSTTASVRRIVLNTGFTGITSLGASTPGGHPDTRYTEASAFGAFPDPATPGAAAGVSYLPLLRLQVV